MEQTDCIFQSIHHTNIRTADLDASIAFYRDILGFEYRGQKSLAPVSPTVSAYLRLGEVVIELAAGHRMEDYTPSGIVNHIALQVDDIQKAFDYLRANHVTILSQPHPVNQDFYCFFAAGPSGERLELIEPMKK